MRKILRIIHSLDPTCGGPQEGISQISPILYSHGISTTVICLDHPDSDWLLDKPFKVIALGKGFLKYGFKFGIVKKIAEIAKNYDFVIVHGLWQFHSLAASLALRKIGKNYHIFTHGMLDPWFQRKYPLKHLKKKIYWHLFESKVFNGSKSVFFTSKKEEQLANYWLSNLKIKKEIINYGISQPPKEKEKLKQNFINKFPILKDKEIILFLSRIDYKKGVDLILEAFGEINKVHRNIFLLIAGPNTDNNSLKSKLNFFIKKYKIKDKVIFTGMLKGKMKWGAFYASDFYCLPSHSENFGIVVAEALACGALVGITNKVNIFEEIQEANAGLIFKDDKNDTIRVINKWLDLSDEDKLIMKRKAINLFNKKFNLDNSIENFIRKLEKEDK